MGDDVLDFTLLKKKGLLKIRENSRPDVIDLRHSAKEGSDTFVNFGNDSGVSSSSTSSTSAGEVVSPFDMLDNLASAGSSTNSDMAKGTNSLGSPSEGVGDLKRNRDFTILMSRVENLEYQLERIMDKFSAVESKVEELMRNVR